VAVKKVALGPDALTMLKNLAAIRSDTTGFLMNMHQKYGAIVQYPVPIPAFSISNPETVDYVLRTNAKNYAKQTLQYKSLSIVTGEGLLTADGEIWKSHRKVLQPAFHRAMQSLVIESIEDSYLVLKEKWTQSPEIEIAAAMQHLTLEVVGRALFGKSLSGESEAIASATIAALDVVVAKAQMPLPIPTWVPTKNHRKLNLAIRQLDKAVEQLLLSPATHPDAFISLLREAHETDPQKFDIKAIRDEIVTFIVAGHETVASAMAWMWQLLNEKTEILQTCISEAKSAPHLNDLAQVPYLQSVFAETMRLYPPAWLITRSTISNDTLEGVEIPANALIIMSPYMLQHQGSWQDPEKFDPSRFSDPQSQLARSEYLPFGLGARMCIGRDMALVEGPLLMARILRDFDVRPTNDWTDVGMTQSVTLHPASPMLAKLSRI
jgi:cytochrome P450